MRSKSASVKRTLYFFNNLPSSLRPFGFEYSLVFFHVIDFNGVQVNLRCFYSVNFLFTNVYHQWSDQSHASRETRNVFGVLIWRNGDGLTWIIFLWFLRAQNVQKIFKIQTVTTGPNGRPWFSHLFSPNAEAPIHSPRFQSQAKTSFNQNVRIFSRWFLLLHKIQNERYRLEEKEKSTCELWM